MGSDVSHFEIFESDKEGSWCIWWGLRARTKIQNLSEPLHNQMVLVHGEVSLVEMLGTI